MRIPIITISKSLESSVAAASTQPPSADSSNATDPVPASSATQTSLDTHALDDLTVDELKEWIMSNKIAGQVKQCKKAGEFILCLLITLVLIFRSYFHDPCCPRVPTTLEGYRGCYCFEGKYLSLIPQYVLTLFRSANRSARPLVKH